MPQAARARQAAQRRRSRIGLAVGASALVVVVIVALIVVKATSSSTTTVATPPTTVPAPAAVLTALTDIPPSTLAQAALTSSPSDVIRPKAIQGSPPPGQTTTPEVFFLGAEFCPFCAGERWAVVTALSKFGTFTGLGQTHSSSTDVDPNTQTFSFYGATYTSAYLRFVSVEETTNQPSGNGGYQPLQRPTPAQSAFVSTYDNPPYVSSPGIPFIDLGGRYVVSTQYDPAVLQGKSMQEIGQAATIPSSPIGQRIEAAAGILTADLCKLTENQPTTVCTAFAGIAQ